MTTGVVYVTDSDMGAIYRVGPDRAVEQVASFAGINGIDVQDGVVGVYPR
ncbi:MAG: hypothetical protein JW934_23785 [Anaerolineae bacterium]|nr:hypothetical protein [Anaerolineae bacterium]